MDTDTDSDTDTETTMSSPNSTPEKTPTKNNTIPKPIAEKIHEHQSKNSPIAGYYPSGFGLNNNNNNNNNNKKKKQSVNDIDSSDLVTYRGEKKNKRVEIVIKTNNNSSVDYVGTNYSGEAAAGKFCGFGLIAFDKRARTISALPLTSSRVFRLEPKVTTEDKSETEPETPLRSELSDLERLQGVNTLTEVYGTSIAVKQARKAQRLRQKENPGAQQQLEQILEDNPVNKAATERTSSDANLNIPPHNLTATSPESAYPLDKIILKGEWSYLTDIVELLEAGQELKPDAYPTFVYNRSHKVELVKDETEKKTVAGIMSYITHLINFKEKHSLDGFSSAKDHKIPSMLFQKFSRMFMDASKNRLADDKIGVLISYVLVLTLHIDEFQSDFTDIARDLKVSAVSLRPYFENLGCKLRRRNSVTVATLPVPLEFPTVRKRRRRG